MSYCGKCGKKNPVENNYCYSCGTPLLVVIPEGRERDSVVTLGPMEPKQKEGSWLDNNLLIAALAALAALVGALILHSLSSGQGRR